MGGTFTDVTLRDTATGRLWITKTPTTPYDPSEGFLAGVDKALALAGARHASLSHVLHGTTTATNAILEGKGGFVSRESALEDYGVILDARGCVEPGASAELRASKRAPVRMFHRGHYFGPLVENPSPSRGGAGVGGRG